MIKPVKAGGTGLIHGTGVLEKLRYANRKQSLSFFAEY
jgi:hypothetical protein